MSIANGTRLLLQSLYFVAIARTLGSRQYGQFVAISAMIGLLTPFAGLGSPSVLLKNVSRDGSLLRKYWGNGLLLILVSGLLFSILLSLFGPPIFGRDLFLSIACLAIAELVLSRIVELASFAFTALGRMRDTAFLNIFISLSRLICILVLGLVKEKPTIQDWCQAVLCGSCVCAVYGLIRIARLQGAQVDMGAIRKELPESAFFAIGSSAATFYNDVDKSMLAKLADLLSAGIYGAAYRIIDVSMAPIRAMTACAFAEFFRRGSIGATHALDYARQLIKRSALFGLLIFLVLTLAAPVLPLVLGESFRDSVEALRWLAIIPLLRSVHLFLGDALAGCGFNRSRTMVQVVVAIINILLNMVLIRQWSWRGAAWASIICDALLLLGFLFVFRVITHSSRTAAFAGNVSPAFASSQRKV